MSIQNEKDLKGMERVSFIAKTIRDELAALVHPGVTTNDLEKACRRMLVEMGAESAPMRFYNAPAAAFYSVNNAVVHGLPNDKPLRTGDVLKIDVTPYFEGYVSDTARTLVVGEASAAARKLVDCARDALYHGLSVCRPGTLVNAMSRVIQKHVESQGFSVIRELSGHGVGRAIHEEPEVLNYYEKRQKDRLSEGLVIAVEPMICDGNPEVSEKNDGWTIAARKGLLTAHFEHTIVVSEGQPLILTA